MELKLNETPVRTSRNFNINNIKIKDIEINENAKKFNNTEIIGCGNIESSIADFELTYGLGKELENEVKNNANKEVRISVKDKESIKIINTFDQDNTDLIDNMELIAEEGIKANVLIKYKSNEDMPYYHNGIIRAIAKANSTLNITIVNLLNTKSNNFISLENNIEENANINYTIIDFGGKHSITNYYSNLKRKFF